MAKFDAIEKHSVVMAGHKTSISLERCFWTEIKRIASERGLGYGELVAEIDSALPNNLSSAIRQFVLADLKTRAFPPIPMLAHSAAAADVNQPSRLPE